MAHMIGPLHQDGVKNADEGGSILSLPTQHFELVMKRRRLNGTVPCSRRRRPRVVGLARC